jgi:hypothetical protein
VNYGELRLVDELHRLDRVAVELLQLLLDRFLTEKVSPQTAPGGGGPGAAPPRPGMPKHGAEAGKHDSAREEISLLLKKKMTGSDSRRIAEILEAVGEDESAYAWWKLAAKMGDPDAADYLEILEEEHLTHQRTEELHRIIEQYQELGNMLTRFHHDEAGQQRSSLSHRSSSPSWHAELEAALLTQGG